MFCPQCGSEYREGFSQCADCEVALVDEPPPPEAHPDVGLVTVLETSDPALLTIAESLLLEEEIPYLGGLNVVGGPVLLQVPEEHAENAREILEALTSEMAEEQEAPDEEEADEAPE